MSFWRIFVSLDIFYSIFHDTYVWWNLPWNIFRIQSYYSENSTIVVFSTDGTRVYYEKKNTVPKRTSIVGYFVVKIPLKVVRTVEHLVESLHIFFYGTLTKIPLFASPYCLYWPPHVDWDISRVRFSCTVGTFKIKYLMVLDCLSFYL